MKFCDNPYWDTPDWPEENEEQLVACKYCGADGLLWVELMPGHRWRLTDLDGNIHRCRPTPQQAFSQKTP
jgi:hypothetical protein